MSTRGERTNCGDDPAAAHLTGVSYVVRESARAKSVRLRMSHDEGLVVVVPKGFNRRRIAAIIDEKRSWVLRATERLRREEQLRPGDRNAAPRLIELSALDEVLTVEYRHTSARRVTARDHGRSLTVSGPVGERVQVMKALKRHLIRRAKSAFEPAVHDLARRYGFTVNRVTVRVQRTRWASCSGRSTISLNVKLLFLPPELARHVILHELCHTVHLNHSGAFWRLLERYDPDYREHDRRLSAAGRYVPAWFV